MDVITFPENLQATSGLSILLHGIILLPNATAFTNFNTGPIHGAKHMELNE